MAEQIGLQFSYLFNLWTVERFGTSRRHGCVQRRNSCVRNGARGAKPNTDTNSNCYAHNDGYTKTCSYTAAPSDTSASPQPVIKGRARHSVRATVAPREAACRRLPAMPNPTGFVIWFLTVELRL